MNYFNHLNKVLVGLVLSTPCAYAGFVKASLDIETNVIYQANSNTRYRLATGHTISKGYVSSGSGLTYRKQKMQETSVRATESEIEIFSGSRVRLMGTSEKEAVIVPAKFTSDGSFRIDSSDMERAMEVLSREKIEEQKRLLPAGIEAKVKIDASDMKCRMYKETSQYFCKFKVSIVVKASAY
jgi:hypothetical protein